VVPPRISIAVAALLLAAHVAVLAALGDRGLGPLLSNVLQLGIGLMVVLATAGAARGRRGFERAFLAFIAARFVIWAVAQGLATQYVIADHGLDGTLADLLFHLQSVPLGLALFLNPRHPADRPERSRFLDLAPLPVYWTALYLEGHYLLRGTGLGLVATDALIAGCFYVRAMTARSTVVGTLFGRFTPVILLANVNEGFATYFEALPGGAFDLVWSVEMLVWLLTALSLTRTPADGAAPLVDRTTALLPLVMAGATLVLAFAIGQRHVFPALGVAVVAIACAATVRRGRLARA
jgi:hypothetical protein